MRRYNKLKLRIECWDRLARVTEEWALLEEEKKLAWVIKERQNVTDATVWAYVQRAELKRTIWAKTRERQKLEDDFWHAIDKYNEYLGAVRRAWEDSCFHFWSKSVHEGMAAAVLTADLVESATSGFFSWSGRGDVEGAAR